MSLPHAYLGWHRLALAAHVLSCSQTSTVRQDAYPVFEFWHIQIFAKGGLKGFPFPMRKIKTRRDSGSCNLFVRPSAQNRNTAFSKFELAIMLAGKGWFASQARQEGALGTGRLLPSAGMFQELRCSKLVRLS